MTVVNRAITAQSITKKHSLANVTRVQNIAYGLFEMNAARTSFFAGQGSSLYQSTDDALSAFNLIHTFATPIRGVQEMANGEAMVLLDGPTSGSMVSYSTGWSTNKATATWSTPFQFQGDKVRADWAFTRRAFGSNGVVVINTYGAKTVGGAVTLQANLDAGCRVYYSGNFGVTFTKIWDALESNGGSNAQPAPNSNGYHSHNFIYDPEWDRIWGTFGDNTASAPSSPYGMLGTAKIELIYSDDRGATWGTIPVPSDYPGAGGGLQFTTIACTHDNVILLPDSSPFNVCTFPRIGYRQLGTFRVGPNMVTSDGQGGAGGTAQAVFGAGIYQANGNDMPIFTGFQQSGAGSGLQPARVIASSNEGNDWYEILRFDTTAAESAAGFMLIGLIGPTASGKIYGTSSYKGPSGTWSSSQIQATLVLPA